MSEDRPTRSNSGAGWLIPVVIAFAAGFLVLTGVFYALDHLPASKPGETLSVQTMLKSVAPMLRERCVTSARASLTQQGVDLAKNDIGAKIDNYCGCAVDRSTEEMSVRDLLAFKLNPSSEPAASKMKSIMQKCQEAIR
jgi:hypothetical protein